MGIGGKIGSAALQGLSTGSGFGSLVSLAGSGLGAIGAQKQADEEKIRLEREADEDKRRFDTQMNQDRATTDRAQNMQGINMLSQQRGNAIQSARGQQFGRGVLSLFGGK